MSDAVGVAQICVGGAVTVALAWIRIQQTKQEKKNKETSEVVDSIHVIVNSRWSDLLTELQKVTRRLADITGERPDIDAADRADQRAVEDADTKAKMDLEQQKKDAK